MEKFTISILVADQYGVLMRISSMFARRGFNIDSLTVGETENPSISRITITVACDQPTVEQVVKQLKKLCDVKKVNLLENGISRELMLVKVRVDDQTQAAVIQAATVYRANIVDLSPGALTIEMTGDGQKLNSFVEYVKQYGVIEMCKTGVTALARGENNINQ